MENNGFIAIHRKMLDNPVVCKDNDYFRVWMQLLLSASHKGYPAIFAGKKIELKAGQLITGRKVLAEKCSISESKIQRILKSFEFEQQIEQQTCNKNRLITIVNWSLYQNCERQNEQRMNNKRTTTEHQMNTNNNVNNDNNADKVNKKKTAPVITPPFTGAMLDKVNEWLNYKKERGQSYKPIGLRKLFTIIQNEIDNNGEAFVMSAIDTSITNNWQGLFFKSNTQNNTGGSQNGTHKQDDEYAQIGWS